MRDSLGKLRWLPPALFVLGVVALYAGALGTGFLNDDYLFLEDAARGPWVPVQGALANYFRPVSRQLWFGLLAPLAGPNPLVFHLASLAVFLGACALLYQLLRSFAPREGAIAGLVYFAVLPFQRVNLMWVSCCQDLLALAGALGAFALFRRGRDRLALLAYLAAVLAKESALPLPALLFVWTWRIEGRRPADALRRVAPFALPVIVWAAGEAMLRASAAAPATLHFGAGEFAAALAHLLQAVTGLDNPYGLPQALWRAVPSIGALAAFVALTAWWQPSAPETPSAAPTRAEASLFGLAWMAAFAVPVAPVVQGWSGYFYTLCAVGSAVLVAAHAARISRLAFAVAVALALAWHAGASAVPAFAVADSAWGWTSHLTAHYFERGAGLSSRLRTALLRVAPSPEHGTRFFFATLPSFAGFQMGNGAAIRAAYRDPSLESHFYSAFSESTAANAPCIFLFWNGADFERLESSVRDPFFEVGTDLLLMDRPLGAAHAFARGLGAGELREDVLYGSGWALLWGGRRSAAEAAWTAFGAQDDTSRYADRMRAAAQASRAGDATLERRMLYEAVRAGIGRPEAHAQLGQLLRQRSAKFALLETKVAAFLMPSNADTRLELVQGLLDSGFDEQARLEIERLRREWQDAARDTTLARLEATLSARTPKAGGVAFLPVRK